MNLKPALAAILLLAVAATASTATTKAVKIRPDTAPTVTPADASTILNAISAQRGHVVVVNFWATWCDPCVAEFPDLVRFAHDSRKKGVIVFAVSADMKKDIDTKVRPFLAAKHADFPQFLQQSEDPENFINAFDPKWEGDLPRTFIYDKNGKLVTELSGAHTEQQFAAAVDPLLK